LFGNAWQLSDRAITPASLQSKQSKARTHGTDEKTEKSRLVELELELGREAFEGSQTPDEVAAALQAIHL
jgi:hypothetical protein